MKQRMLLKRLAMRGWREQNIFSAEKMRAFQKHRCVILF
jgi:hypothetical protein